MCVISLSVCNLSVNVCVISLSVGNLSMNVRITLTDVLIYPAGCVYNCPSCEICMCLINNLIVCLSGCMWGEWVGGRCM